MPDPIPSTPTAPIHMDTCITSVGTNMPDRIFNVSLFGLGVSLWACAAYSIWSLLQ